MTYLDSDFFQFSREANYDRSMSVTALRIRVSKNFLQDIIFGASLLAKKSPLKH